MNTRIFNIDETNIDINIIKEAGTIIAGGGLVAFPTETVYGLGGDALNAMSSKKIYAAKGRPSDNPLIVHIARKEDLPFVAKNISDKAERLIAEFWPGPLTMIFEKTDVVPMETTGGLNTVAVRFPSDRVAQEFIKASGGFVAAPSANISGKPSPTSGKYVIQDMDSRIDMILCGSDAVIGLESTIVDMTVEPPMILRPGYITREMLECVVGNVDIDKTLISSDSQDKPKAPGMKYRHYAPQGELKVVEGKTESVITYINEHLETDRKAGKRTGVISVEENTDRYNADVVKNAGSSDNIEEVAHRLFDILRSFDDEKVDIIYSESFDSDGVGSAVMNRLLKAAGHNIIRL